MGYNRALRDLDGQSDVTKTQLAILCIIICFAIDAINPVKVVLHVFPQIASWHVVILCALLIAYLVVTEIKPLLYFSVKVFFHSILSIVFREVHVIGLENVPQYGPVIFTGNHANQFIDAVTMVCTCQRTISYLVAEKSWNRPIIGHLAWALGAVPVKRAQDSAEVGVGKIRILHMPSDVEQLEGDDTASQGNNHNHSSTEEKSADVKHTPNSPKVMLLVQGFDTVFSSQIQVRDKIRTAGSSTVFTVQSILSDTELHIEILEDIPTFPSEPTDFHILKRVDQGEVYAAVLNRLGERGCIGIFPEGGSHDRRLARAADTIHNMLLNGHFLTQILWPTWIILYYTLFVFSDLLPLKVGVALIAYSALERDGVNIPIVPVGLNYFNAHRFRGRAIVEFGAPLFIDPNTLDSFKQGGAAKRQVCTDLLERIQDSMRSVIVTAPDYESLQLIHTCRRLFQQTEMTASDKQDLARRFSEGYRRLLAQSKGNPPKEWVDMYYELVKYQKELEDLGIRDYQVTGLKHERYDLQGDTVLRTMRIPFRILVLLFVMGLALVPGLLLNYPVGLIARLHAERRRRSALAESTVKIRGQDVILSEKVTICIVLVPLLWCIYAVLLYIFSEMDGPALALSILSMPLFSYMGIMMTQAGMIQLKDLRPYIVRIFPSSRRRLSTLPAFRKELQQKLRLFIKEVSPIMGEVYYEKDLDWHLIHQKWRKSHANLTQIFSEKSSAGKKDI